jgi:hypothetical protein
MPVSLNLTFTGTPPADDEHDHPPGAALARLLQGAAKAHGWACTEFDNWRDVGWSISCKRGPVQLKITIAPWGTGRWMLQVAPERVPGPLGRALGRTASAASADCLDMARAVHEILSREARYSNFRWRWDGPPTEESGGEPSPAP